MHRNAEQLSDIKAAARRQRREQIGKAIMRLDPDRNMVVKIYGEDTTRMIEEANMY
jgi:hypothetical protein